MRKKRKIYGQELILDLKDCDPKIIRSGKKIEEYSRKLCNLIKMKRFGAPFVERFGLGKDFTAGYSLVQLIETSSLTGHFSEEWNAAYINIFSCQPFDKNKAREFTRRFFKAKRIKNRFIIR